MKKILFLILTMLSFSASAAWTEVTTDNAGDTYYIDFDTLKKNGSKRTVWRLTNYKKPLEKYYSSRTRDTFDCAQDTVTALSIDIFTQHSLRGQSVSPQPDGKPVHIAPSTVLSTILRLVCSK